LDISRDRKGTVMTRQTEGIGLTEALELLRAELAAAQASAAEKDVQFPIETLTVELRVGLTRSNEGRAGFTVPFIGAELGGSAGHDRETVQTVTIVLGPPVDHQGRPVKVSSSTDEQKD
jgi:Trypsin-co-occurring domain 2